MVSHTSWPHPICREVDTLDDRLDIHFSNFDMKAVNGEENIYFHTWSLVKKCKLTYNKPCTAEFAPSQGRR